jgi:hypothetical protein
MTAGIIASGLWWTNHEFLCPYHSTMVLRVRILPPGMNGKPVGGCSSETHSHPIDMIITIIIIIIIHQIIRVIK